jgi:hypothetical protein
MSATSYREGERVTAILTPEMKDPLALLASIAGRHHRNFPSE